MLTAQFANLINFFYPIGNTPAVSLTQGLPLESPADILLLGCGDVRHILFTAHTDDRPLDITCCDIEKAVIGAFSSISYRLLTDRQARNILLLSFIIDDIEGNRIDICWKLYYHFRIDEPSLRLLQNQAQKLYTLSTSLQSWHSSKYGKRIRILDNGSLEQIRAMWNFYGTERKTQQLSAFKSHFETGIKKAKQHQDRMGFTINLTGVRSSFPAHINAGDNPHTLHQHYWEHGCTYFEQSVLSLSVHPNPMFTSLDDNLALHYGTDPLLGFHLATAYAPLAPKSPLFRKHAEPNSLRRVVEAARAEFDEWVTSFRKHRVSSITLRFFVGDAIAFSHSLQHKLHANSPGPAHWYRDRFHFKPLVLDDYDYGAGGSGPRSFTIIDTSNLIDHVGALNLLAATSPLLSNDNVATLYTEKLVQSEKTYKDIFDDLLCGNLHTLSMLLDLIPIELVTNTSVLSAGDELLLSSVIENTNKKSTSSGQLFSRIAWKRPPRLHEDSKSRGPATTIHFEPASLANILYRVYLKMFESEDMKSMFSDVTLMRIQKISLPKYQRASFVALIHLMKSRIEVDWASSLNILRDLIENNDTIFMTGNYIQELYTWLHLLGLYSVDILKRPLNTSSGNQKTGDLRDWKDAPSVICVTLEVPRTKLALFYNGDIRMFGTPPIHCVLQASGEAVSQWQNIFAAVQIGFGKLTVKGDRFTTSAEITIDDDELGWAGNSSLFASFYAPTWMLLQEPRTATVSLCIQSTPQTAAVFFGKLGLEMNIYKTTLADADHVYITNNLPNQASTVSLHGFAKNDAATQDAQHPNTSTTIKATVDASTASVTSLESRVNILSEELKAKLKDGCEVQSSSLTPFNFCITLKDGPTFMVDFPTPVLESSIKTRIARKSSYIELVAQVASSADWPTFRSSTYPVFLDSGSVVSWNMSSLKTKRLPVIDTTQHARLSWLTTHSSMMFSEREKSLRNNSSLPASPGERVRVEFKDSLFSLFMHFSGLQGRRAHIFGINCAESGGVNILLFVSKLRLDLSNRSVVLDAAALPLYDALMPRIRTFLQALSTKGELCQINATEAELHLWKQVLPAWVERCRSWSHKPNCEYLTKGRVPLSMNQGERFLCSCGDGFLPADFSVKVPQWDKIAKYVVHVAISPVFSSAMVESVYEFGHVEEGKEAAAAKKDGCDVCGKESAKNGTKLLFCAGCRQAKYCSKECQRAGWKTHKKECTKSIH